MEAALSSRSIDINDVDLKGWTPLMIAAYSGSWIVTKMLLDAGANVAIVGNNGSALHVSLGGKHLGLTTHLLVDAGANLEEMSPRGLRPIHLAVEREMVAATKVLIDAGADVDAETKKERATPLLIAACMGYVEMVRMLLEAKASPLLPNLRENVEAFGETLIMVRASSDPRDHRVRPPNTTGLGIPLDRAATAGHASVVLELIQRVGIEGCGGDTGGLNALGEAALGGHLELMAIFAAAGVVDTGKVLVKAAGAGKEAPVRFLLQQCAHRTASEKVAYINNTGHDLFGGTPLTSAIFYGFKSYSSRRIVRLLLDHGANVTSAAKAQDAFTYVDTLRLTKETRVDFATDEQMQRLESIHRLLLQEDAVHATSWLWPGEAVVPTDGGAAGASCKTKPSATSLTSMLPVVKRRASRPRLLLKALSRCVYLTYLPDDLCSPKVCLSGTRFHLTYYICICIINPVPQLSSNPTGTASSSTSPPPLVTRQHQTIATRRLACLAKRRTSDFLKGADRPLDVLCIIFPINDI